MQGRQVVIFLRTRRLCEPAPPFLLALVEDLSLTPPPWTTRSWSKASPQTAEESEHQNLCYGKA